MHHSKIIAIIFAALWLGGAFCAPAHAERERGKDIAALLGAKTSLVQAISTVEQQGGGQAVQAEAREDKGAMRYVITTLSKGKATKTLVDPETGTVVDAASKGVLSRMFGDDEESEHSGIGTSKFSLAAAVTMAEQQSGGKAVEAGFKNKHGKPRFEIEVAKDGAAQEIRVDGTTGQVLKTKAKDAEHDDD